MAEPLQAYTLFNGQANIPLRNAQACEGEE